eukprot:CAMPEP_0206255052 /NCGR_PEP_ID=MMETSP0047_2-20121206/24034_1 /ASSEMBLY_ACC=CAM_ASM_000192 /TAXON_ID=195065 /ORGANISM="Chroomonas mesostigmatica_cf, Strain CCMP1168" /LENGTH=63 /DNA_ID=CAMNT_0053681411 /DNA_START=1 /DNA_END=189 /DNA_ORIENTATION=-
MWACATLGMKPTDVLVKLCGRAEDVVHDFQPQNVSNLMWACCVLRCVSKVLVLLSAYQERLGA